MPRFVQLAINLLVIVTGAMCHSEGAIQTPRNMVHATNLSVKETPHLWPCKNGNLFRNGVSQYTAPTDLTTPLWEWSVPGANLFLGHIEASPVIDRNSNVYLFSTTGGIFALTRDGTQLWERWTQGRLQTGFLHEDSLYISSSAGIALSLDLATGNKNWQTQFSPKAGMDSASATVAGGLAIFPGATEPSLFSVNNEIVALKIADGSEKWRWRAEEILYNFMPSVIDDKLIFIGETGRMYCLSLLEGILQWNTEPGSSGHTTSGAAIGPYGLVYTNFNTHGSLLTQMAGGKLVAYDVQTGAERWSRDLGVEASAAPVVGKMGADAPVGVLIGVGHNQGFFHFDAEEGQGELRAFDAITGEDMWTFRSSSQMLHGDAGIYAAPFQDTAPDTWSNAVIGSDGTIYAGWQGGKQYAVEGTTGKMLSSHFTGWGDQGEPAMGDGFVVFPSIGRVVAFAKAKSQENPRGPHDKHSTEEMRTVFM